MKRVASIFIRVLDKVICFLMPVAFVVVFFTVVYFASENKTLIDNAGSGQYSVYKPTSEDQVSFDELRALNPDVLGWLTINGTAVDYPIVQGNNNSKYVNTSVLGEFSLSGALFLDNRNNSSFTDALSIIYGHNMVGSVMFGDFYLYEDEEYFNEHRRGTLFYDGEYHEIDIFAFFSADGYDIGVYDVGLQKEEQPEWLDMVRERAVHFSEGAHDKPLLLLSTCATNDTNGRTVILAEIGDTVQIKEEDIPERSTYRSASTKPKNGGEDDCRLPLWPIIILIIMTAIYVFWTYKRKEVSKHHGKA